MLAPCILLICWPGAAGAWSGNEGEKAVVASSPAPREDGPRRDDIVVTAPEFGSAEVAAETAFGEDEIASYGADSIGELVSRLGPLLGGDEEGPVILVNGVEIGYDRSILNYPAEALNRLDLLRPEAAAQYGQPAGRRVVNLVLKKSFVSRQAEVAMNGATAGGQYGGELTIGQTAIAGTTRWNIQARIRADSALLKSARRVPQDAGPVDLAGHIAGFDGREIDPALSAAAGRVVTAAAIPHAALQGVPTLADFAGTAPVEHGRDPGDFESLRPSRRTLSATLGVSRPLGPFTASFSLDATANRHASLRGVPMQSFVLPGASPWSPFADDVLLVRPAAGGMPLRNESGSDSLGLSLTLSGRFDGWRVNMSGNYARTWARNRLDREDGSDAAQALIGAGDPSFNPYEDWGDRFRRRQRSRSNSESAGLRFNVLRSLVTLPAGDATANMSFNASQSRTDYRTFDESADAVDADRRRRSEAGGRLAFSLPVSRRGKGGLAPLGDLVLEVLAGGQLSSGTRLRTRYGGSLTWSPVDAVEFRGSFEQEQVVASAEQLGAPRVETVNRIYDFGRREVAEPIWITGGNPRLRDGSRRTLSLGLQLRPLADRSLIFNIAYRAHRGRDGIAPFPELTPAIEAAFPDRVTRDGAGRLVAVDARAINLASTRDAELASSIILRLPGSRQQRGRGAAREGLRPPLRVSLSLNHSWRLENSVRTRAGAPSIDRLSDTGQARHFLSFQATVGRKGMGAEIKGSWSSPARVRGPDEATSYRYRAPLLVSVGLFVEPEHIWDSAGRSAWLRDVKVSLDIDNVLDDYRRATLSNGETAPGYSRDEVDPLGRTIELTLRKRF